MYSDASDDDDGDDGAAVDVDTLSFNIYNVLSRCTLRRMVCVSLTAFSAVSRVPSTRSGVASAASYEYRNTHENTMSDTASTLNTLHKKPAKFAWGTNFVCSAIFD